MTAADVIAFPLDAALEQLHAAGVEAEVEKTYPSRPVSGNGKWRVVRQKEIGGKVLLTAAEECEGISP